MRPAEGSSWPRPGPGRRPAPSGLTGGRGRGASRTASRNDGARGAGRGLRRGPPVERLRLMVGEREVVVHDRDLVTRILNAAGGE